MGTSWVWAKVRGYMQTRSCVKTEKEGSAVTILFHYFRNLISVWICQLVRVSVWFRALSFFGYRFFDWSNNWFLNLSSFSTHSHSTSPCSMATTWATEGHLSPSFNKHKKYMFNNYCVWIISSLHKWSVWSTMTIKLPSLCSVQAYINIFLGHFFI